MTVDMQVEHVWRNDAGDPLARLWGAYSPHAVAPQSRVWIVPITEAEFTTLQATLEEQGDMPVDFTIEQARLDMVIEVQAIREGGLNEE
jgi:hypothetical protein